MKSPACVILLSNFQTSQQANIFESCHAVMSPSSYIVICIEVHVLASCNESTRDCDFFVAPQWGKNAPFLIVLLLVLIECTSHIFR